ncbi:MAG: hypothetical protein NTZ50_16690, partial [Chloroflexi bacterium]|nr:hypothetical protein [Chloroflexota bacterium]
RRTRTNGSAVDMHPWMAESDFDRGPLLLPSSLDEFNPYTRIVSHCEFDDLQVGDQIVIATDAVARWLTPRREDGAAWETLGVIADDVAWKQWIEQQRDAHMIGNDDSTLVLLVVEEADLSASGVLASAPPQPFDSAREIELGKALESGQSLAIAEAWGDGVWLGDQLPSFVDQVAPHLKIFEGIHALRRVLIGFHQDVTTFAEVESAWLLHRVALADATVATGIRQALQEIGVKTKLPPAVVLAEPVAESLSEELPALVEALELSPAVVQAEPVAESLSEELPALVEALELSPAVVQPGRCPYRRAGRCRSH